MSKVHIACPMTVRRHRAVVYSGPASCECCGTKIPYRCGESKRLSVARTPQSSPAQTVGDLVSWSVDTSGHIFPAHGGAADEPYPHVVVDRAGIEWTVREVETPQPWARRDRCLVLNSRECVRRLWEYPDNWRMLDADILLDLGTAD